MNRLDVVILAAGKGERMASKKPKVMHEIMGKPLIGYVVEAASSIGADHLFVVTGYGRESVEAFLADKGVTCVVQTEQLGTAHALSCADGHFTGNDILVLLGDVPFIQTETLLGFLDFCRRSGSIVFLTTDVDDPSGYGRVLMDGDTISDIREDAEATEDEKKIKRINTGICYIPFGSLGLLEQIGADNRKGERYLTDICKVAGNSGKAAKGFFHGIPEEVLGINTQKGLLEANILMRDTINEVHMAQGVTLLDNSIYIERGVRIGRDTVIASHCNITGETSIGEGVFVGPCSIIRNCVISDNVVIEGFVSMEGVEVKEDVKIGPFSRLRAKTVLGRGVKVGNFVEVKNSVLYDGTKASHLSYIGDCSIGKNVNIGAGTITCNYDGVNKHRTFIGDNVFVGSNTELIAPVTVGNDVLIGAGTTVTRDIPDGSLAVSRVRQKNIAGYRRK